VCVHARASVGEVTGGTGCSDSEARQTSDNTSAIRLKELRRRDILFRDYHVSSVLMAERLLANNSWIVQGQGILQKCPNGTFLEGKVCVCVHVLQKCPPGTFLEGKVSTPSTLNSQH